MPGFQNFYLMMEENNTTTYTYFKLFAFFNKILENNFTGVKSL